MPKERMATPMLYDILLFVLPFADK